MTKFRASRGDLHHSMPGKAWILRFDQETSATRWLREHCLSSHGQAGSMPEMIARGIAV
jgi:hypothetical protein